MQHVAANLLAHHFGPREQPGHWLLSSSWILSFGFSRSWVGCQLFLQVTHTTETRAGEIWVLAVMVASSLYFPTPAFNMAPSEFRLLVRVWGLPLLLLAPA